MAVIELSESTSDILGNVFKTKADQSKYVSGFGVKSGKVPEGFKSVDEMRSPQIHELVGIQTDGFEPFQKNGKDVNVFKHNGVEYVEMIALRADYDEKYRREEAYNHRRVDGQLAAASSSLAPADKVADQGMIPNQKFVSPLVEPQAVEDEFAALRSTQK